MPNHTFIRVDDSYIKAEEVIAILPSKWFAGDGSDDITVIGSTIHFRNGSVSTSDKPDEVFARVFRALSVSDEEEIE